MKCYEKYIQDVPQEKRVRNVHPTTPDRFTNYSRRGWDMLVKIWKKKLHHWEPTGGDANGGEQSMNDSSSCLASENTTFDELDVLDAEENVSELLLDQNVDEEV
jgi:histone RNA hairpin-binding protein